MESFRDYKRPCMGLARLRHLFTLIPLNTPRYTRIYRISLRLNAKISLTDCHFHVSVVTRGIKGAQDCSPIRRGSYVRCRAGANASCYRDLVGCIHFARSGNYPGRRRSDMACACRRQRDGRNRPYHFDVSGRVGSHSRAGSGREGWLRERKADVSISQRESKILTEIPELYILADGDWCGGCRGPQRHTDLRWGCGGCLLDRRNRHGRSDHRRCGGCRFGCGSFPRR
jgi:hypothetical protein